MLSHNCQACARNKGAAKQLVELPMLVGQYHMLPFALNSIGVQREPGASGLPR